MPRQARLGAPNTVHHVLVRGLECRVIFIDDVDRADFVARLAALAESGALTVYGWALLPNHAHLLVRTGRCPLARSMRPFLEVEGCAGRAVSTSWAWAPPRFTKPPNAAASRPASGIGWFGRKVRFWL